MGGAPDANLAISLVYFLAVACAQRLAQLKWLGEKTCPLSAPLAVVISPYDIAPH